MFAPTIAHGEIMEKNPLKKVYSPSIGDVNGDRRN